LHAVKYHLQSSIVLIFFLELLLTPQYTFTMWLNKDTPFVAVKMYAKNGKMQDVTNMLSVHPLSKQI